MTQWRRTAVAVVTAAGLVTSFAPPASAATVELKQNNSDEVSSGFACGAWDTTVLRRYDLDGDYDITLPFDVTSATYGVWITGVAVTPTADVTLYTIPEDDETLAFADMTVLATTHVDLPTTELTNRFSLESSTFDATIADPTSTDLVLAVRHIKDDPEIIESGAGYNNGGETAPTYVATCNEAADIVPLSTLFDVQVPMWVEGEEATDEDGDGVADADDNCVSAPNEDQANHDDDALGDACDDDDDGDTVLDDSDNCPVDSNLDQADNDLDGPGDACDDDDDNDFVLDNSDNCVNDPNGDQANHDDDQLGDACDDDDDGDTVLDEADACDLLAGNPNRPKAEGCPAVPRTVTAHFASGDIDGSVESAAPECTAEVPVVVSWRKNDGTMKRRTTTTDALGDFSVHTGPVKPDGAHHWFFWVRVPAVLVEDVGLCGFTTLRDPDTRQ